MNFARSFSKTTLLVLLLIMLAGLYLRMVSVRSTVIDTPLRADARDYVAYALNLERYGVYSRSAGLLQGIDERPSPDALRTPGYPLFLYLFTDHADIQKLYVSTQYVQVLLSSISIFLAFLLGRALLGDLGGLGVAGLMAISPHLIVFNSYLLTEPLFTFLLLFAFTLLAVMRNRNALLGWAAFSVVMAVALLTRPSLHYFVIFIAAYLWSAYRAEIRTKVLVAAIIPMLLAWIAWSLWTASVTGGLGDSAIAVGSFYHGTYPDFMYRGLPESYGFPYRFDPESEQISKSLTTVLQSLWSRFLEEPATYLRWYLVKTFHIFDWSIIQGQGDIFVYPALSSPYYDQPAFQLSKTLMQAIHPLLVILALLGAIIVWLPSRLIDLEESRLIIFRGLSLLIIYFLLIHVVGAPFPRYGVPLRPFLYLLATLTVVVAFRRLIGNSAAGLFSTKNEGN